MSTCVFGESVSADADSLQREAARSTAEEFVSRYYYSMYTDSDIDLYGCAAYEEMADYLSAKLKYQQSICSDVVNMRVGTYAECIDETEEALLYRVHSGVEFNYVGADFDSGFTSNSYVMIEKGGERKILDVMIGGMSDNLLGRDTVDINNCYWEREGVTGEAVAEVCDYIDEVIEKEKQQAEAAVCSEPETYSTNAFSSSVTNSQRYSIVQYAITNTRILLPEENGGVSGQEVTPKSGNPQLIPQYHDFSVEAPGNYDCTNFTSHCLLAGGAKMNMTKDTGWYFISMDIANKKRTPSWSSVKYFHIFVTNNKGDGPKAEEWAVSKSTERKLVNCNLGDIIQIDYTGDGVYDHNVVITNVARAKDGYYWPAVTGRSGSRYADVEGYETSRNVALPDCKTGVDEKVPDFRVLRLTSLT